MLKFLGKRKKRQLLRSLFSDPLPEGHPGDRDNFICLNIVNYYAVAFSLRPPDSLRPGRSYRGKMPIKSRQLASAQAWSR